MKKFLFLLIVPLILSFNEGKAGNNGKPEVKSPSGAGVVHLTNDSFKKMIFNYDLNKEWKYEGTRPAIIDFYADWCAPCRQMAPLVEEIARDYSGKIDVYKVNTDNERMLAQKLGITALPTILFVPAKGNPRVSMGALPKDELVKAINEILLK